MKQIKIGSDQIKLGEMVFSDLKADQASMSAQLGRNVTFSEVVEYHRNRSMGV